MRSTIALALTFSLAITMLTFGQTSKARAYLDTKQFYNPSIGNYLEIQLQFVGYSLNYKALKEGVQATVAIRLNIISETKDTISDLYLLNSPIFKDSIIDDFYDIRRFKLTPGNYQLSLEIQDVNNMAKPLSAQQSIEVIELKDKASISAIEIAEFAYPDTLESVFQKSGFYIIPKISNYYPTQLNKMPIYLEVYNLNLPGDSIVGIKQSVIDVENKIELEEYTTFNRLKPNAVTPIFKTIDLSLLPSGKYALNYSLVNRKMEEKYLESYVFERTNDFLDSIQSENVVLDPSFQESISEDSVIYFLESLIPIAKPAEIKNIISSIQTKNNSLMRKHIQAFWKYTAPNSAYEAWIKYKNQIYLVERSFGNNFQEGFETDRGRVYLKYGSPSSINARETSPTEYPYEIWIYNKIGSFSNKRFVFYNPDLVNNAYRLLHSDMLGELKNPSWQQILVKRNTMNGDVDNPNKFNQRVWGGNSNDLFRQY